MDIRVDWVTHAGVMPHRNKKQRNKAKSGCQFHVILIKSKVDAMSKNIT